MSDKGIFRYHMTDPTSIDVIGFQARRNGLEIRDCLLILEPGGKSKLGLLTRSEIEGTVHEEVVRRDRGALDIDAGRIRIQRGDKKQATAGNRTVKWGVSEGGCSYEKGTGAVFTNKGRWPSNLLLKHGEGCKCVGTKKVKGSHLNHDCGNFGNNGIYGAGTRRVALTGYADEDGKEEVPNWNCQPSCPVAILDAQSGISKSGPNKPVESSNWKSKPFDDGRGWNSHSMHGSGQSAPQGYADVGGASRFYQQVTSDAELEAYLQSLVRSS